MTDLFSKFDPLIEQRETLLSTGLTDPFNLVMERVESPTVAICNGKRTILLGTYNYMGMTFDPDVVAAGKQALDEFGSGTTGSRVLNGTYAGHRAVEQALKDFYAMDHAMVFSTGYQANLGIISTIAGKEDYIVLDIDSHASIYDGCALGNAQIVPFRHNDIEALEKRLKRIPEGAGKLVVLEGVYSMLGDIAPLRLVCRPYVFTASLPPSVVATAATSIRKLMDSADKRAHLWENSKRLHAGLRQLGFTLGTDEPHSAIIAVIMAVPQLNLRGNLLGAFLIVVFGFLFVTVSSRLTGEIGSSSNPISGMTVATLLLTCLVFLIAGWTGPHYFVTALSIGGIVCIAASNGGTTSQDLKTGFLVGSTPKFQQIAILFGALASALTLGFVLLFLNNAYTVYVPVSATPELRAPANELGRVEKLQGLQGLSDQNTYRAWQRTDPSGGAAQRYLVNPEGVPVYLVDPGINGTHKIRPDGSSVTKFDAPKATLMSYIIKGILSRKLPWALVLLGVMIAIVLEMSGIPSLAFAVGVYLPLASSSPIFIGGMIRLLVDRYLRVKFRQKNLSEMELTAEGDKSPGVLLASGYIAGGAITGIVIAAKELLPEWVPAIAKIDRRIQDWQMAHNPFLNGSYSDLLALIPFAVLCVLLYLVGRDVVLRSRSISRGV